MKPSPDRPARMVGGRHSKLWRAAGPTLLAVTALVGAGLVGAGLNATPPQPPQPATETGVLALDPTGAPETTKGTAPTRRPPTPTRASTPTQQVKPVGLGRSEPTKIEIKRIGVSANLISLGLNPDGTLQVPPLEKAQLAGWYNQGPTPGEIGNSVIVGHVDSAKIGPAVFFKLGALKPNDTIRITRRDKTTATFTVNRVAAYPKAAFPTELVYGPNTTAALRIITCGGTFDRKRNTYPKNTIVFATLTTT